MFSAISNFFSFLFPSKAEEAEIIPQSIPVIDAFLPTKRKGNAVQVIYWGIGDALFIMLLITILLPAIISISGASTISN